MSKALKILSRPRGNAEEYGRWSVNPYIGCSHGCHYCDKPVHSMTAQEFLHQWPHSVGKDWSIFKKEG